MKNESWDVRMDGDMVIAGLSERTREAYLRAARQLAKFHHCATSNRTWNWKTGTCRLSARAGMRGQTLTVRVVRPAATD
jgi:hypothetical protein